MNRTCFAQILHRAVLSAFIDFRHQVPDESPYALAVIMGQCGNYLGYAIATEEGLRRIASQYCAKGYCYNGREIEEFNNLERLSTWLRWANPDDGWHYGDFSESIGLAPMLANFVTNGEFGEDAEELEEFCTEVLFGLQSDANWQNVSGGNVVVGVTFGSDPMDFLRTATRANKYGVTSRLWAEYRRGEELSSRISATR